MRQALEDLDKNETLRGRVSQQAKLGEIGWFRCGGKAEQLFKPADVEDLKTYLSSLPSDVPVMCLGVMSNTIVRDGGVKGSVVRLGGSFTQIDVLDDEHISAGAMAFDRNVAQVAADYAIAGLEFFSGIPGTIGGALKMNAGCYGSETKDVLVEALAVDRQGKEYRLTPKDLEMAYRKTNAPEGLIFIKAIFKGKPGNKSKILQHMNEIQSKREATQPIKERTGGSTFANPSKEELLSAGLSENTKVWQLIDNVGGRGLTIGGAKMSELHCNFMINMGSASACDLEKLGEEIRRRVLESYGIRLRWEIRRVGEKVNA